MRGCKGAEGVHTGVAYGEALQVFMIFGNGGFDRLNHRANGARKTRNPERPDGIPNLFRDLTEEK